MLFDHVEAAKAEYFQQRVRIEALIAKSCMSCRTHAVSMLEDVKDAMVANSLALHSQQISPRFYVNAVEGLTITLQEMADDLETRHGAPMAEHTLINVFHVGAA